MQWFRLYAEFASDPKVQMMSEAYQRRWAMLLCMRCAVGEKLTDDEIMFQLRISETEWSVTKSEFIERKFINKDNKVINWKKRQYRSDCSTERVYKHREKRKQEKLQQHDGNVTCNAPEQNRTEQNREEPKKPSFGDGKESKTIPAFKDWTDDDAGIAICKALRFSGIRHPQWVSRACPYIRERMNFKTNQEVMDWLPGAWKRYEAGEAEFKYGFEKWLGEGHYAEDKPAAASGPKFERPSEIIKRQVAEAAERELRLKAVASK